MLIELIDKLTKVNTWVFNKYFRWESYFLIIVERHCLEKKTTLLKIRVGKYINVSTFITSFLCLRFHSKLAFQRISADHSVAHTKWPQDTGNGWPWPAPQLPAGGPRTNIPSDQLLTIAEYCPTTSMKDTPIGQTQQVPEHC